MLTLNRPANTGIVLLFGPQVVAVRYARRGDGRAQLTFKGPPGLVVSRGGQPVESLDAVLLSHDESVQVSLGGYVAGIVFRHVIGHRTEGKFGIYAPPEVKIYRADVEGRLELKTPSACR